MFEVKIHDLVPIYLDEKYRKQNCAGFQFVFEKANMLAHLT